MNEAITALWETSAFLENTSVAGGMLKAVTGNSLPNQPTILRDNNAFSG
jgi:hypothetical protein